MNIQESFADKFLKLVLKSKTHSGSNKFLASLLKKDPKINKTVASLGKVVRDIEKWAESERKSNPEFAQAERDVDKIMRDN